MCTLSAKRSVVKRKEELAEKLMPTAPIPAWKRRKRPKDRRVSASKRGYNRDWRRESKRFLRNNPLCVECGRQGIVVPAVVVDHIIPHKGDMAKFWDMDNWQGLCAECHNRKTGYGC